jgi:YggT family protein
MTLLYRIVDLAFWLFNLAILLRVLLSWIQPGPSGPVVYWIYRITEPLLEPLRRVIPPFGGIDITPVIALMVLEMVHRFVISLLF